MCADEKVRKLQYMCISIFAKSAKVTNEIFYGDVRKLLYELYFLLIFTFGKNCI